MTDLLNQLVLYLAAKVSLEAGKSIFYNEMPDSPDKCVCLSEKQTNMFVPPQIDAEMHKISVQVRDTNNTKAAKLAQDCWRWLLTDIPEFDVNKQVDTTGFITLPDGSIIQCSLYGNPVWEKADQQRRKYYSFLAVVLTKR